MIVFGLMIGITLMVAGWVTHTLAPRVGPDHDFGLPPADALAYRKAWERGNRVGGLVLGVMGVALIIVTLTLRWLRVDEGLGMTLLVALLLALVTASAVGMVQYSHRFSRRTTAASQAGRPTFRWRYLAPSLVVFALSMVVVAVAYSRLPAGAMATHFALSGEASGWMSREAALVTFLGIELLLLVMNAAFVWISSREAVFFPRRVERRGLSSQRGLTYVGFAFAVIQLTILLTMLDGFYFSLAGGHLVPMGVLLTLVFILSLAPIAFLVVVLGRSRGGARF